MNNPLVSIIVPCYNQAQYLDEALQSVFNQTYINWECIIVNDGSPDNTEEVAQKWIEKDKRFKYLFQENGGLSSARNLGINNAIGDWIQFLDSDDILDYEKLELSLNNSNMGSKFEKNIVISNFRLFEGNYNNALILSSSNLQSQFFNLKSILFKWDYEFNIPIHCGLFQSVLFNDFRFPEEIKAKEDWIMWLSLFQNEPTFNFIDKPLAYYRVHQNSMTKNYAIMQENQFKAIEYLKCIISDKDYEEYLIFALKNKFKETFQLRTSIKNYKNTRTYKISQKVQKTYFAKWFLNFLR